MAIYTAPTTTNDSEVLPPFATAIGHEQRWFIPIAKLLNTRRKRLFGSIQFYATLLCFVIIVTVDMAAYLTSAPQVRLFESIICLNYYRVNDPGLIDGNGNIPEQYCKIDFVQSEIAMLNGLQTLFSNIPGVVLAIPFGVLADRFGRRIILVVTILGLTLSSAWVLFVCWFSLPIKLTWLSSAFYLLGGGSSMGSALILMIIADVTPEGQRSTIFFQLQACVLLSELIAPLFGSVLMNRNVWIPLLIGLGVQSLGIPIALALPETKGSKTENSRQANPTTGNDDEEEDETENIKEESHRESNYREVVLFLLKDINVTLLVFTFLVATIGRQALEILLQYVSKRYKWSLAKANFLFSLRAGINLALLLVVLPALASLLMSRWKMGPGKKDLYIARTSIILMAIGFLAIAISPAPVPMMAGLMVYTFGSGFSAAARSLVTSMVNGSNIGKLYTSIAVFDTLGGLVAGPALSLTFSWGMKLGGGWIGLPFLFSAVLFGLVAVIMFLVRLRVPADGNRYERLNGDEEDGDIREGNATM